VGSATDRDGTTWQQKKVTASQDLVGIGRQSSFSRLHDRSRVEGSRKDAAATGVGTLMTIILVFTTVIGCSSARTENDDTGMSK